MLDQEGGSELKYRSAIAVLAFALTAQACTQDQSSVRLTPVTALELHQIVEQKRGKVVLVNAWASWCEPCKDEMPALLKLRRMYASRGLEVIMVSADDIADADTVVKPMLKRYEVLFPTYIANDSSDDAFMRGLNPNWSGALPATFIYDRSGKLAESMIGGKTFSAFERAVRRLLTSAP